MTNMQAWLDRARAVLEMPLLSLGSTQITLWLVAYLVFFAVLLFWVAKWVQNLAEKVLSRTSLDIAVRQAAGTLARYLLLLIGLLVILQTAGIDLTTLNVLAGALGIGVGFGLQNVISNFFSGLIIMFERPIKIGDRIEVNDVEGDVIEIGARSTVVMTNDNIAIIVPNSKFITENVVNWMYNDGKVRFRVPVGVSYGSDVRKVEKVLLEVAAQEKEVLRDPPPAVRMTGFGDSALEFELRVWSDSQVHRKGWLVSALNMAIHERFREQGIEIPFPQRDLHIRSGGPATPQAE